MEARAQTMLIPTPAPVGLALPASTVKPTYLIALKALASMEERVQIKSMVIPVTAAQASLAPTASMRSMSVTPSPASMEASVKMPWSPSVAPALRATLATAARLQSTGADAHLPAKMEDAVAKKTLPSSANVPTAGLDVTVISIGFPVKQLLAREGFRPMISVTMVVTVLTLGIPTIVNVLLTTLEAIAKAKWTIVKTNPAAMVPPAGDMWEDTSVTVCQAILDRTARQRSMSASLIPARMEAPALTWWDITSAPALLGHSVFSVRLMKMTVLRP